MIILRKETEILMKKSRNNSTTNKQIRTGIIWKLYTGRDKNSYREMRERRINTY